MLTICAAVPHAPDGCMPPLARWQSDLVAARLGGASTQVAAWLCRSHLYLSRPMLSTSLQALFTHPPIIWWITTDTSTMQTLDYASVRTMCYSLDALNTSRLQSRQDLGMFNKCRPYLDFPMYQLNQKWMVKNIRELLLSINCQMMLTKRMEGQKTFISLGQLWCFCIGRQSNTTFCWCWYWCWCWCWCWKEAGDNPSFARLPPVKTTLNYFACIKLLNVTFENAQCTMCTLYSICSSQLNKSKPHWTIKLLNVTFESAQWRKVKTTFNYFASIKLWNMTDSGLYSQNHNSWTSWSILCLYQVNSGPYSSLHHIMLPQLY